MDFSATARRLGWSLGVVAGLAVAGPSPAAAVELNDKCVVSVLNRTAYVQADGSWVLPNTPANIGRVRARATCVEDGVTRAGQSDYFQVPLNGIVRVPEIRFDVSAPVPSKLVVSAPQTTLGAPGATVQLVVTATYPDGSTADVTASSQGTNYTSTNPAVASVTAEGLVTANASGTVIVMGLNDGATGLLRVQVVLSGDTDGDGIPDDIELANGLNPNDPVDALEDYDSDGLTNRQELELGTQIRNADTDGDTLPDGRELELGTEPLLFDTDGDGLSDGLEVSTGSDPLDPSSYNLAQALSFIEVRPTAVALVVNTLIGEASRQLAVTGHLIDNTTIDLTSTSRGTNYASSNLSVVSFGLVDGQIFGGADGNATVTVSNAGFAAAVPVNVRSFAPRALSWVAIPGFANNVDVAGSYAYVAAGSTGLQIVDVSNHAQPFVAASLDTTGNANDVVVSGTYAYVADGAAGLRIIDVANPLAPVLRATFDTPGVAWDVVVRGGRAYVADGASGLRIVDVSDPSNPVGLGFYDTPGTAKGVDVQGALAVVADGSALRVIDVTDPAAPVLRGSLGTVDARDVALDDLASVAYVADYTGSLKVVSVANPAAPALLAATSGSLGGYLTDVVKLRNFTFGSDVFFVNGVPITDVSVPGSPQVRARLDFTARDDNGTGIAVDSSYVYLTGEWGTITENGVNGNTRLYIGQYLEVTDEAGIAPTVAFTSPAPDAQPIAGTSLTLRATADDDVAVASVTFAVDGVPVGTDFAAPYEATVTLPTAPGPVTFTATALDFGGNVGTAQRTIAVQPDPAPTVVLTAPAEGASVVAGATIALAATAADNGTVQNVRFSVQGLALPPDATEPYGALFTVPLGVTSLTIEAAAQDNLGQTTTVSRSVQVVPDAGTTVRGRVVTQATQTVEGASVELRLNGVRAEFFDFTAPLAALPDLSGLTPAATRLFSAVDFRNPGGVFGADTFGVGLAPYYAVRLQGLLTVSSAGTYAFRLGAAGGARVQVGSTVVAEVPVGPAYAEASGTISLGVGQHALDVLYAFNEGDAELQLLYTPPAGQLQAVPSTALVQNPPPFTAVTDAAGAFTIAGVPVQLGDIGAQASVVLAGVPMSGSGGPVAPVSGGVTEMGDVVVFEDAFETDIGTRVATCDDCWVLRTLPFPFPFYGATYTSVYVNNNGHLTFGGGDGDYTESQSEFNRFPRISPLWDDLIPSSGASGLYVNDQLPGKFVATWFAQAEYGGGGQNTLQATLYPDGRIRLAYNGLTTRDGIAGITPGGSATRQVVDFSAAGTVVVPAGTAALEQFSVPVPRGSTDPSGSGAGPDHPFDMDQHSLLVTPDGFGGYTIAFHTPTPAGHGHVEGLVKNADGEPLRDTEVRVVSSGDASYEGRSVTSDAGFFRVAEVPLGQVTADVVSGDQVTHSGYGVLGTPGQVLTLEVLPVPGGAK